MLYVWHDVCVATFRDKDGIGSRTVCRAQFTRVRVSMQWSISLWCHKFSEPHTLENKEKYGTGTVVGHTFSLMSLLPLPRVRTGVPLSSY